jgi:hypothetical protein
MLLTTNLVIQLVNIDDIIILNQIYLLKFKFRILQFCVRVLSVVFVTLFKIKQKILLIIKTILSIVRFTHKQQLDLASTSFIVLEH